MFFICSIQHSTRPGQFSTRPDQNALALASGGALVSLTVIQAHVLWLKNAVWFKCTIPFVQTAYWLQNAL